MTATEIVWSVVMKYLRKRKMSSYIRVPCNEELNNIMGYSMPKVTFDENGNAIITFEDRYGNIVRAVESPDGAIREIRSIPKYLGNTSGI